MACLNAELLMKKLIFVFKITKSDNLLAATISFVNKLANYQEPGLILNSIPMQDGGTGRYCRRLWKRVEPPCQEHANLNLKTLKQIG